MSVPSPVATAVRDQLVAYFESRNKLVAADALRLLVAQPWPLAISQKVIEEVGPGESFVTVEMVQRIVAVTAVAGTPERPHSSSAAPNSDLEALAPELRTSV
ncbi:MAG TPA: hypothetical protein VGP88_08735, partial [Thermoplasmata archaeon]|nr:hypothetical protein [Thermoplasmata archaeon]